MGTQAKGAAGVSPQMSLLREKAGLAVLTAPSHKTRTATSQVPGGLMRAVVATVRVPNTGVATAALIRAGLVPKNNGPQLLLQCLDTDSSFLREKVGRRFREPGPQLLSHFHSGMNGALHAVALLVRYKVGHRAGVHAVSDRVQQNRPGIDLANG